MSQNLRVCNKCNWVHFGITAAKIKESSSPAKEEAYMKCFRCGNSYLDFRCGSEKDCPMGSTIQGILTQVGDGE